MIQLARGSSVRKHLDAALGADAPAPVFEVEHLATATGLVRAGLGISVVPAMTLFHFGGADLRIVPLAGKALTRPLYLVRRKGRTLSVAAQALYDLLREHRGDIDSPGRHGFG
jgi:DNA-binding transcriptional LysR family regulator